MATRVAGDVGSLHKPSECGEVNDATVGEYAAASKGAQDSKERSDDITRLSTFPTSLVERSQYGLR